MIQKAEQYTSGKYLNWNLKLCPICIVWEIAIIAIENFQSHPTGKVWYVHRFPSGKVCFGRKSRVVHHVHREVSELEFKNMSHMYCMGNIHSIAVENFSKSPVGAYTRCTGKVWYVR